MVFAILLSALSFSTSTTVGKVICLSVAFWHPVGSLKREEVIGSGHWTEDGRSDPVGALD